MCIFAAKKKLDVLTVHRLANLVFSPVYIEIIHRSRRAGKNLFCFRVTQTYNKASGYPCLKYRGYHKLWTVMN